MSRFPRRNQSRTRVVRRASRPVVEGLEDRMLLYATTGGGWSKPVRITYSFVPDGTDVGGTPSNLFATLNAVTSTATWQAQFQKAAAYWSTFANINMALVPDDGSPIGAAGNQQDDPRFGDIRIAMTPQGGGVLAYAMLPPPFNGGTAAGDVVFNSAIMWGVNTNYDIETVALHEIGHALGLGHSTVTTAEMYPYYNGIKQTLTSDDIAGIQAVYGAYPADTDTNTSFTTATPLTPDANGQVAVSGLNIAGSTDADFFVVTVPANTTGTMKVSMQSANLSSLSPKIAVYNSAKTLVTYTSLANSFGATATVTLTGVQPGQVYYLRASQASSMGSYGAYGLLVNFGSLSQPPIAPPDTTVATQPDQTGGSFNELADPSLTSTPESGATSGVAEDPDLVHLTTPDGASAVGEALRTADLAAWTFHAVPGPIAPGVWGGGGPSSSNVVVNVGPCRGGWHAPTPATGSTPAQPVSPPTWVDPQAHDVALLALSTELTPGVFPGSHRHRRRPG